MQFVWAVLQGPHRLPLLHKGGLLMFIVSQAEASAISETTSLLLGRCIRLLSPRSRRLGQEQLIDIAEGVRQQLDNLELPSAQEPTAKAALAEYLSSPEFYVLTEHVIVLALLGHITDNEDRLGQEVASGLRQYGSSAPEDASLRTALGSLIVSTLTRAIPESLRTAIHSDEQATQALQREEVRILLERIERAAGHTTAESEDQLKGYEEFIRRLRSALLKFHGDLIPPTFDARQRIPIDTLYVPSTIHPTIPDSDKTKPHRIPYPKFLASVYRTVILGDPGGGKSTLATKVVVDAAKGLRHLSPQCQLPVIPFLVILREYDSDATPSLSLASYIAATCASRYQVEPPDGVVEWLLDTGRCLVVFDGLDELLNTARRMEVVRRVELFASNYASVPIVVTSRRVGYAEAPLDKNLFDSHELAGFDDEQVSEYVRKWFTLDASLAGAERDKMISTFESESATVSDLRSNPLLLSLMCSIYRGENYIPRNRPAVYEKCARMLFERWDKSRGIHYNLPFEHYIDSCMKDLAFWIYSDEKLQSGVTERELVRQAASYLGSRLYTDSDEEAQASAQAFVEFCTGRAWVFTDTGLTGGGEPLFQFTHRTFLEYFAAAHLVRTAKSPQELVRIILPRIARAEWDMVAQMAVHQYSRDHDDAYGHIIGRFASELEKPRARLRRKSNIASFVARCLAHVTGSRDRTQEVVEQVFAVFLLLNACTDVQRELWKHYEAFNGLVRPLVGVAPENRLAVVKAMSAIYHKVAPAEQEMLAGLILYLVESELPGGSNWLLDHWKVDDQLLSPVWSRAAQLPDEREWAGAMALLQGSRSVAETVRHFGVRTLFTGHWVPGLGLGYSPIADTVLYWLWQPIKLEERQLKVLRGVLTVAGQVLNREGVYLGKHDRSFNVFPSFFQDGLFNGGESAADGDSFPTLSDQEKYWAGLVVALIMERDFRHQARRRGVHVTTAGPLAFMMPLIARWATSRHGSQTEAPLEDPELERIDRTGRLRTWSRRGVRLLLAADEAQPG